jgi:hypothetical protein
MPCVGRRVFSNNQDTNFHDYLANKKGVEMMKYIKSSSASNKINVLSYSDFMNLTKTFSKNSNILATDIKEKRSVSDTTISTIYYEKLLSHIKECNVCKENKMPLSLINCNSIKNIIYAYENHFRNTTRNIYQKGVCLDRWCKRCDSSYETIIEEEDCDIFEEDCDIFEEDNNCDIFEEYENSTEGEHSENKPCKKHSENKPCNFSKDKHRGQGRKPIFCSQCNKFIDMCLCCNRWSRIEAIRRINHQNNSEHFHDRNKKTLFV